MAVSDAPQVRVRIAPSPTGFAHLGTASTTLYNVLFARANSGSFALRIDDTDVERNREEYERLIYEALHWLGFEWDLFGDFIIVKSDGYPTYNFASPVDDAAMHITHVIRGEEHLPNTPYQLLVIDALGYERPQAFAHMPLILAPDGGKLSKRKHPEANLMLYRQQGYLPQAMHHYLALLGWTPGPAPATF